mmetsp:Transcript_13611/g.15630  ORF Transcript_13611/g.15630 Transcript_13611/m.15630 type:complete len:399 (-) Transcript_13611:117-1313(-)
MQMTTTIERVNAVVRSITSLFLVSIVVIIKNNGEQLTGMRNVSAFASLEYTTPPFLRITESPNHRSDLSSIQHQFSTTKTSLSSVHTVTDDDVLASYDNKNSSEHKQTITSSSSFHTVQGVVFREVSNELPIIGKVVVLEATADSQEDLINECIEVEEEQKDGCDEANGKKTKRIMQGDPYGSVLWPASWAVSNYVLTQPDLIDNLNRLSILELGSGTGLVSISIAMGGAKRVVATDYEPLALALTRYAADNINKNQNQKSINPSNIQLSSRIETQLLDLCDLVQQPLPLQNIDVVLAADIMYEPRTGEAMAHRAVEALRNNCRVIVGDSPGRPGRPAFLSTLKELGVEGAEFQETIGKTCSGPRHDLICGKGSTSVSETPQALSVALLDLIPTMLKG